MIHFASTESRVVLGTGMRDIRLGLEYTSSLGNGNERTFEQDIKKSIDRATSHESLSNTSRVFYVCAHGLVQDIQSKREPSSKPNDAVCTDAGHCKHMVCLPCFRAKAAVTSCN